MVGRIVMLTILLALTSGCGNDYNRADAHYDKVAALDAARNDPVPKYMAALEAMYPAVPDYVDGPANWADEVCGGYAYAQGDPQVLAQRVRDAYPEAADAALPAVIAALAHMCPNGVKVPIPPSAPDSRDLGPADPEESSGD